MESTIYTPEQINTLPEKPGIYRYFNQDNTLIYVGKAKNLKKRVQSYFFNKNRHDRKTLRLVNEIHHLEITIVDSELDALLLENNHIKAYQPKYNILLKDDKSYPYIVITNEPFPKVFSTRQYKKGYGIFYGPFSNVRSMHTILELIRELFHIRTCSHNLSERNIQAGKFEVCLEYHIKKCFGPCVGKQSEENYLQDIDQIKNILKGKLGPAKSYFKTQMNLAAENLEFEKAQTFKHKLELLEQFQAKSIITNPKYEDIDVFAIKSDEQSAFVHYMKIINGAISQTKTIEVKRKLEETDDEILQLCMVDFRKTFNSQASEILTNIEVEPWDELKVTIPKIGDKRKLLELAIKNALFFKKEKIKNAVNNRQEDSRLMKVMANDLRMKIPPKHIECFDNSNIQGTNPVASMVCFKNGKPSKKDYRKFHIKTVVGPDDFASMKEVVGRRYGRLIREGADLPDLVVIDGGKGQLSAAVEALKEVGAYSKLTIIGIAKRLEELYYPGDQFPLHLDKKSETLRVLQHLRNEAHRFAITFHRDTRSKNSFKTILEDIPGVGPKTIETLLKAYKSTEKVKQASLSDLTQVVGKQKAHAIIDYLKIH
ncbi:excinuclease ABC subunit UvrC [Persicobacter psychrovividus]|uniref:UvrABC system protein C n=1 Tax=Persicobacter psychrovividus TaxID=387638 RepID=A0ABN6LB60_9BACT|nr:UvrABC system protein C [Persicobacter psychrovividus]